MMEPEASSPASSDTKPSSHANKASKEGDNSSLTSTQLAKGGTDNFDLTRANKKADSDRKVSGQPSPNTSRSSGLAV